MPARPVSLTIAIAIAVATVLAAAGCSTQQLYRTLYATGDSWQRNQCEQITDGGGARSRCLTRPDTSYDAYGQQASATPER